MVSEGTKSTGFVLGVSRVAEQWFESVLIVF